MSSDARSEALLELVRFNVSESTVGDTLQRIAEITLKAVSAADISGITMLGEDGQPTTGVYTDEISPEVDAAQYAAGRGPCLDAWREHRVVLVDHIDDELDRYPEYEATARAHGILSTLGVPLLSQGTGIGAMNLYARTAHSFTPEDATLATELGVAAASVLANVCAYWTAFDLGQQLDEAMRTRAVIEQAKGMLMARSPALTADEAFDVLRRASQRENVKLRTIAARLVDRTAAVDASLDA